MKFSDGGWLTREGYTVACPEEIYSAQVRDGALWLYAPCKKIAHRGMTLGGPAITYRISAPREGLIRVQAFHHMGQTDREPHFTLYTEEVKPRISIADDEIRFDSGGLSLVLDRTVGKTEHYLGDFSLAFYEEGRLLTASESRGLAYITGPDKTAYMREELSLSVGETIYGLGERFTPFVKNGQSLDSWNRDGGTSTEQSYKCIPFYLTNRGYGVLVNHPEKVEFEIASEKVGKAQFSVAGEMLDYIVIGGGNMSAVLQNYTALTGRPPCPPAWSFGLWLSTSFLTNYDEQTVNHFIDGMAERQIPLQVFHFDCFWMRAFQWTDFIWDSAVFPDPKGMLGRLHAKGLRVCVWINPYIAQQSALFEEGKQQGYFLKRPNGDVWQWDLWQPSMAIVDFTNPEACDWYAQKLTVLLDMGVDTFKTDFGERIPTDVVYDNGTDPQKMHNYYTYLYNELVYNTLRAHRGEQGALVFARSATVGGQQFPVHWGGDNAGNFASMAESLRGGLSLSLSGFGFWSHDIGGFESTSTPDVYKRWAAFGLLSSHSRLHGSHSYRVPWQYDEEAVDVLRFFTRLKCRLMPALFAAAVETAQTGFPFMRPMVLAFPEDPACTYLDRQYTLCGGRLLVAPVFNQEGQGRYYLPAGRFTHLLSGEVREGGRHYEEGYDYFSLPLFVRPNTLLPMGSREDTSVYDYDRDVVIHAYEPRDAAVTVYDTDGTPCLRVSVVRKGDDMEVVYAGRHPFSLFFHGLALAGQPSCEVTETGTRLPVYDSYEGTVRCRILQALPDSGSSFE